MHMPFHMLPEESTFYHYQKEGIGLDRIAVLDGDHCECVYIKIESTVLDSEILWAALKGSPGFLGGHV